MIHRKLLIVHESTMIRSLLNGFILSELNDVIIAEAASRIEAERLIRQGSYHVILSSTVVAGLSSLLEEGINFIMLISNESTAKIRELDAHNLQHYLAPPYTPVKLREKINEVFNPSQLRTQNRFNIPDIEAILHSRNNDLSAEVINISKDGLLCEVDIEGDYLDLLKNLSISIEFPRKFKNLVIKNIKSKFITVKVLDWDSNHTPKRLQIVWMFIDLKETNRDTLHKVFEIVQTHNQKLSQWAHQ